MQKANSEHSSKSWLGGSILGAYSINLGKTAPQRLDNPLRESISLKTALNKGGFEKLYLMEADFLSKIWGAPSFVTTQN